MTILVTGATGFIGSHIAKKLVQRGERVRIFLLKNDNRTLNIKDIDAETVYGDILDIDSVKQALKGCDTLYHTAGLVSYKKADYKKMADINIKGTANVLSSALDLGIRKVVYTSSVAAIGVDPDGGIANEKTPFTLGHMGIGYINTKHYAEREAIKFHEKGLPLVIVNPTAVIGPGDIFLSSTGFILWYCKKKIPAYMDGGANLVDVEDVAEGHILAAERGRLGERYILGNQNLTVKELFSLLEKSTGIPKPKVKIPYFFAIASGFVSERILRIPSPNLVLMDVDSPKFLRLPWYFDSDKAVRELGFPQTPIEKSIEKTVKWFKDNHYLDK